MKLSEDAIYHLIQELEGDIKYNEKMAKRCLDENDTTNFIYYNGLCDGIETSIHFLKLYLLIDDKTHERLKKTIPPDRMALLKQRASIKTSKRTVKRK